MSDPAAWQEANSRYLSEALEWVRKRLSERAGPPPPHYPADSGDIVPAPALRILSERFNLSRFEEEVLLLCVTAALASGPTDPLVPTFGLAIDIFDDPVWEALSPEGPLRRWRLIEVDQSEFRPLAASPLRASERVVNYLKGMNHLDEQVAGFVALVDPGSGELTPSQQSAVEAILPHFRPGSAIRLQGRDAEANRWIAARAAAAAGLSLYHLRVESLPAQPPDIETLSRLWGRECALLPVCLYVSARGGEPEASHGRLSQFLERLAGTAILDSGPDGGAFDRAVVIEIPKPAWNEHAAVRPRLDLLAQRVEPKATWNDIVLPPAEIHLLRHIAGQVRQRETVYGKWGFERRMSRGLGINALFAGESGTGKTMAAEVIANELALDLYRIDLASVVSKYIGETEKNLRRLFAAAEGGGAILFFDEADALFGKRSEVKDSHDRYANIEIGYLLQRMESYRGLAILATNMKSALDSAFLRRLRFVVDFPFPGPAERREMWSRVFPPETPRAGLDFDHLARLSLTGGSIHNIALNAAFLAAGKGEPVSMALIEEALHLELRKMGRPVSSIMGAIDPAP